MTDAPAMRLSERMLAWANEHLTHLGPVVRAYADEVALLEQQVPRWVSVKERLPSADTEQVLVWDADVKRAANASFPSGWQGMATCGYITHWMPLPLPPEVKP